LDAIFESDETFTGVDVLDVCADKGRPASDMVRRFGFEFGRSVVPDMADISGTLGSDDPFA